MIDQDLLLRESLFETISIHSFFIVEQNFLFQPFLVLFQVSNNCLLLLGNLTIILVLPAETLLLETFDFILELLLGLFHTIYYLFLLLDLIDICSGRRTLEHLHFLIIIQYLLLEPLLIFIHLGDLPCQL